MPGWAGAEAELRKDAKHRAKVEEAGGVFVPLVVEAFGRWTPFAAGVLKKIAKRGTAFSGVAPTQATNNLKQQLSVKLWLYNAKMILHKLSVMQGGPAWLTQLS